MPHDLKNKANNIRLLVSKGNHRIKIYTENDSDDSKAAIKLLCDMVGKDPEL